jgi:hypothetical protein
MPTTPAAAPNRRPFGDLDPAPEKPKPLPPPDPTLEANIESAEQLRQQRIARTQPKTFGIDRLETHVYANSISVSVSDVTAEDSALVALARSESDKKKAEAAAAVGAQVTELLSSLPAAIQLARLKGRLAQAVADDEKYTAEAGEHKKAALDAIRGGQNHASHEAKARTSGDRAKQARATHRSLRPAVADSEAAFEAAFGSALGAFTGKLVHAAEARRQSLLVELARSVATLAAKVRAEEDVIDEIQRLIGRYRGTAPKAVNEPASK